MDHLLAVRGLSVAYRTSEGRLPAVRDVDLVVDAGEVVGLAGESGCGKSTLASTVLRLQPKDAVVEGEVLVSGRDVQAMEWGELRALRWAEAAIVFQGALHSLNPVRRVELLERVRVEAGNRGHRLDRPGLRVERHRRTTDPGLGRVRRDRALEALGGDPLCLGVDRQGDVRALGLDVAKLVDDRLELVLLADQEVVLGLLDPGVAELDVAVAERVPEQRSLRVAAHVDGLASAARGDALGEEDAVGGRDLAAGDLLLLDQRPAVRVAPLELLRVEYRPLRGEVDEAPEEDQENGVEADDRRVHATTPPAPLRGVRARSETSSSSASRTMLATIELPPKETNGSVTPVSGITLVTPPMITNACRAKIAVSPVARSFENASGAITAVLNPRAAIRA
jgi:ABC-type dipeptide/oligopeptide/nickel transport system ATPase subunit